MLQEEEAAQMETLVHLPAHAQMCVCVREEAVKKEKALHERWGAGVEYHFQRI